MWWKGTGEGGVGGKVCSVPLTADVEGYMCRISGEELDHGWLAMLMTLKMMAKMTSTLHPSVECPGKLLLMQ